MPRLMICLSLGVIMYLDAFFPTVSAMYSRSDSTKTVRLPMSRSQTQAVDLTINPSNMHKSKGELYGRFLLSLNTFTMHNMEHSLQVAFPYNYVMSPGSTSTYSDVVHIDYHTSFTTSGVLGFEVGSTKGLFFDVTLGAPMNFVGMQSSMGMGYNINLPIKNLVLQPEAIYTYTERDMSLKQIPFYSSQNIMVAGKEFKYKCSCGVSGPIEVTIKNQINSMDLRLSLKYAFTKNFALRLSADYWSPLRSKSFIRLKTKHNQYDFDNMIQEKNFTNEEDFDNSSVKKIYTIDGFSFAFSMLFAFKTNHRAQVSRTHHYYYHGSHFHSFHSCH